MKGLALLLLVVVSALPAATAAPQDHYFRTDGVSYYMAFGTLESGNLALGPAYSGTPTSTFEGCALAQLRPDLDHGRIRIVGRVDNKTLIDIDVNEFSDAQGRQGGVATNLSIDGRLDVAGRIENPAVLASAAAWGPARMMVDEVNFTDPVGAGYVFDSSFFVANDGFRNDTSKGIALADGAGWFDPANANLAKISVGEPEMHMRITSLLDAKGEPDHFGGTLPGTLPDGTIVYDPAYLQRIPFDNTKLGGRATMHVALSSQAPPGSTALTFAIISPAGSEVANASVAASIGTDGQADLDFPLDHFGSYTLRVQGKATLAKASVAATLSPPAKLDLNLWWDRVEFGATARDHMGKCLTYFAGGTFERASIGRATPPRFPVGAVLVAVAAAAATIMVTIKFVSHTRAASSFRKTARK